MSAVKLLLNEILDFSLVTQALGTASGSNRKVKHSKMAQFNGCFVLWCHEGRSC